MAQQDPGEEREEDSRELLKGNMYYCSDSTRSGRGARRRFEGAFERKHVPVTQQDQGDRARRRFEGALERKHVLVTQQDQGEELEEDSRELLKGIMY